MILTLYSFKGGVGRSMALANLAELYYQRGLRVLMIDFDLEAPGLERFFEVKHAKSDQNEILGHRGVIDLILSYKKMRELVPSQNTGEEITQPKRDASSFPYPVEPLKNFIVPIYDSSETNFLHLIPSGLRKDNDYTDYSREVLAFDWDDFFDRLDGGTFFEWFRREAEEYADVVLIDSRTGITEMGGVCTHLLGDVVVLFIAPNEQNIEGTKRVTESLQRTDLVELDRNGRPLRLLYIPSRVDFTAKTQADDFIGNFHSHFSDFYDPEIETDINELIIPYAPLFAFKELVAVREADQSPSAKRLITPYMKIINTLDKFAPEHIALKGALSQLSEEIADPRTISLVTDAIANGKISVLQEIPSGTTETVSAGGKLMTEDDTIFTISPEILELLSISFQYEPPPLPDPVELPEPGEIPPGSRLPFVRNAAFTNCEDDLLYLGKALLGDNQEQANTIPVVAITGFGGIGKTQLAVEFCCRYGRFFHGVHWLQANQDMLAEIANSGKDMFLQPWPETIPEQVQMTLEAWSKSGTRLVVMDGVEDSRIVQEWLPRLTQARVIITSRKKEWSADLGLNHHPLDIFTPADSVMLMRFQAPRLANVPDQTLSRIADRLGNLPLALDLAARYLQDRRNLRPESFLDELNKVESILEHSSLKNWTKRTPTKHEASIAATFTLSWEKLNSESARWLFCACGYCAPEILISWSFLTAIMSLEVTLNKGDVTKDMIRLEDLGLVEIVEDGAVIHKLLNEFARLQDRARTRSALPALVEALTKLSFNANESGLPNEFKPFQAHMEMVAKQAEKAGLAGAGMLWNNLGYHLWVVAEYQEAKVAYERALAIAEATFGPDHSDVAIRANNLGGVLRDLGDYEGAKTAFKRALAIWEQELGPDHPQVATGINNLGLVLKDQGDYEGAKEAFEQALAIDKAALGPDHPSVAIRVNNLGNVLQSMGDYEEAKAAFERALAIDEAALGPDHPDIAIRANNLGLVLRDLGDYEGAKANFERALAIDEAAFGPEHPVVATDVNNLGLVLNVLGDVEGARAAFERALAIDEATFGPDHPNIAIRASNLGLLLQDMGDYEGAKAELERALAIDEAALGPDHPEVAIDVNNLGLVLNDLGDYAGARAAFERALAIDEAALGPDHPTVAIRANNLGLVLDDLGDYGGAKAAFERALAIDEAALGPDHPNVARDVNNLGLLLRDMGDLNGAQESFQRALIILDSTLPPDHPSTQIVQSNLMSLK